MTPSAHPVLGTGPLKPGAAIAAGYEVVEHLRRGNDLDVYDCWSDERLARCVIKALRPDRLDRSGPRRRLHREGTLLERLTHPHIVRAYEWRTDPLPLIVLETLTGSTLSALLEDEGPPGPEALGHLGLQLGSAVAYLHANGYLHLDLKPSNVIAEGGRAKLLDLSLARPPGPAVAGIGTWDYLSPEQARGGVLGPPADVWGLGAVLYEMVAGVPPYEDEAGAWTSTGSGSGSGSWTPAGSDSRTGGSGWRPEHMPQLEREPRPPQDVAPVSTPIAEVISACLSLEPARRPSLAELLGAFEELADLPGTQRRWSASAADGPKPARPAQPPKR